VKQWIEKAGIVAFTEKIPYAENGKIDTLSETVEILCERLNKEIPYGSSITWNCIGDSITYTHGFYFDSVIDDVGLFGTTYGVPGSTIAINTRASNHIYANNAAFGKETSICDRILSGAISQADIWSVFGGTNDWYYGSSLGAIADVGINFDKTTVYGALQAICEYILTQDNHPKLLLITPLQAERERYSTGEITYAEIRKAIIDVAALYSVPFLDLWAVGGFNKLNIKAAVAPTTSDGVHPTTFGTSVFYPKIAQALKDLLRM
jgi:hypothetical protein